MGRSILIRYSSLTILDRHVFAIFLINEAYKSYVCEFVNIYSRPFLGEISVGYIRELTIPSSLRANKVMNSTKYIIWLKFLRQVYWTNAILT